MQSNNEESPQAVSCVGFWGDATGQVVLACTPLFETADGIRRYPYRGELLEVDKTELRRDEFDGRFSWLHVPQSIAEGGGRVLVYREPEDLERLENDAQWPVRMVTKYLLPNEEREVRSRLFRHYVKRALGTLEASSRETDDIEAKQELRQIALAQLEEAGRIPMDFFAVHPLAAYLAKLIGNQSRQLQHSEELRITAGTNLRRIKRRLLNLPAITTHPYQDIVAKGLEVRIDGGISEQPFNAPAKTISLQLPNAIAAVRYEADPDAIFWFSCLASLQDSTDDELKAIRPMIQTSALAYMLSGCLLRINSTEQLIEAEQLRNLLFVLPVKISTYKVFIGDQRSKNFDYWQSPKNTALDAQIGALEVISATVATLGQVLDELLASGEAVQSLRKAVASRLSKQQIEDIDPDKCYLVRKVGENSKRQIVSEIQTKDQKFFIRNSVSTILSWQIVDRIDSVINPREAVRLTNKSIERQYWHFLERPMESLKVASQITQIADFVEFEPELVVNQQENKLLNNVLNAGDASAAAHKDLARRWFRQGNYSEAAVDFEAALKFASIVLDISRKFMNNPINVRRLEAFAYAGYMTALCTGIRDFAIKSVRAYEELQHIKKLTPHSEKCLEAAKDLVKGVDRDKLLLQFNAQMNLQSGEGKQEESSTSSRFSQPEKASRVWRLYQAVVLQSLKNVERRSVDDLDLESVSLYQELSNDNSLIGFKCTTARMRLLMFRQEFRLFEPAAYAQVISEVTTTAHRLSSFLKIPSLEIQDKAIDQWTRTSGTACEYLSSYWFGMKWIDESWLDRAKAVCLRHLELYPSDRVAKMRSALVPIYQAEDVVFGNEATQFYATSSSMANTSTSEASRWFFEGAEACMFRFFKRDEYQNRPVEYRKQELFQAHLGYKTAVNISRPPHPAALQGYAKTLYLSEDYAGALDVISSASLTDPRASILGVQIVCSEFSHVNEQVRSSVLRRFDASLKATLSTNENISHQYLPNAFRALGAIRRHLLNTQAEFDWTWMPVAVEAFKNARWNGIGIRQLAAWGIHVPQLGVTCGEAVKRGHKSGDIRIYKQFSDLIETGFNDAKLPTCVQNDAVPFLLVAGEMASHSSASNDRDALIRKLVKEGFEISRVSDILNALGKISPSLVHPARQQRVVRDLNTWAFVDLDFLDQVKKWLAFQPTSPQGHAYEFLVPKSDIYAPMLIEPANLDYDPATMTAGLAAA